MSSTPPPTEDLALLQRAFQASAPFQNPPVIPRTSFRTTVPVSPPYATPELSVALASRFRLLLGDAAMLACELVATRIEGHEPPPGITEREDGLAIGGLMYYADVWANISEVLATVISQTVARDLKYPATRLSAQERVKLGELQDDFSAATEHATRDLLRAMLQKTRDHEDLQTAFKTAGLMELFRCVPPCGASRARDIGPGPAVLHATAMDISAGGEGKTYMLTTPKIVPESLGGGAAV